MIIKIVTAMVIVIVIIVRRSIISCRFIAVPHAAMVINLRSPGLRGFRFRGLGV